MQGPVYDVESEVEQSHWWFTGRRTLVSSEIERLHLPRNASILDVGTGTGSNRRMLESMGFVSVAGIDASIEPLWYCREKNYGDMSQADACALPFRDGVFDLVLATDVIEHLEDDAAAFRELARVLAPGGRLIVTVPCFEALWGLQDDVSLHLRRYTLPQLLTRADAAALTAARSFYFNYLLFAPIWAARRVIDLFKIKLRSENELNHPLANSVLKGVFRFDVVTSQRMRPPFGVSAFACFTKGNDGR